MSSYCDKNMFSIYKVYVDNHKHTYSLVENKLQSKITLKKSLKNVKYSPALTEDIIQSTQINANLEDFCTTSNNFRSHNTNTNKKTDFSDFKN